MGRKAKANKYFRSSESGGGVAEVLSTVRFHLRFKCFTIILKRHEIKESEEVMLGLSPS